MLKLTLEIVPFGIVEDTHTIGAIRIGNDGSGDQLTGNYQYSFHDSLLRKPRHGVIKGFKRAQGAWELVRLILEQEKVNYGTLQKAYADHKREATGLVRGRVSKTERGEEPTDSEYYNRGIEGPSERIQGERST